jgi:magnesium chelatase family protein
VFGELSLGGQLRRAPGALAVAEAARRHGLRALIVSAEQAPEAGLIEGVRVIGFGALRDAVDALIGRYVPPVPARTYLCLESHRV